MARERYRHIILEGFHDTRDYTTTGTGGRLPIIPSRKRRLHSALLRRKLAEAWTEAENEQAVAHVTREGVYLEFRSDPGADLVTKSLEDLRSGKVRLLNVRTEREVVTDEESHEEKEVLRTFATVYVAHEKKNHFLQKIEEYAKKDTESGRPRHADLINSISDIRKALLIDSFWQDDRSLIPADKAKWCEVWLSSHEDQVIERFEALLQKEQIRVKGGDIRFPERAVKVVLANREQLQKLTALSDDIAEYRAAKETAAFWMQMENREQAEWVKNLLDRSQVDPDTEVSVCILDTGVNNGHPLLGPVLKDEDCQAVDPAWGREDHNNHGTLMAGIAAYGDLRGTLSSTGRITLRHLLESVKVLPVPPGENAVGLWGHITAQAVSLSEIQAPERKRILCLAVTATDTRDRGRPSSWSAALDKLASGADESPKRLFIVAAGNIEEIRLALNYPDAQLTDSIHDPAQAWNGLTVGAYTELDDIRDPALAGYRPIAPRDGLSPFSTTSLEWEDRWPVKPEIVMEGGNIAHDGHGFATECDDLSLLSTNWKPTTSHFYPFVMTSAATAQACWFAAQIQSQYPNLWPETIRGLMIHSAEWTDVLKSQFLRDESKKSYATLLRICGYGVPNLERALHSASNSLTLISQAELQPYDRKANGGGFKTREMHSYDLPWPKGALSELPLDVPVQMRITLSYFIEPGPGEIGWKDRYRYASHGLRFDVNAPDESQQEFLSRINAALRQEDEGHPASSSASGHWKIGPIGRNKGSVHSDIWTGSAAELAASNLIAVYPIIGWWRERGYLGKWNRPTRYSLIVSVSTPEENVDIYTPVANQVGITIPIPVQG